MKAAYLGMGGVRDGYRCISLASLIKCISLVIARIYNSLRAFPFQAIVKKVTNICNLRGPATLYNLVQPAYNL